MKTKKKPQWHHLEVVSDINEIVTDIFPGSCMILIGTTDDGIAVKDGFSMEWEHDSKTVCKLVYERSLPGELIVFLETPTAFLLSATSVANTHGLRFGEVGSGASD